MAILKSGENALLQSPAVKATAHCAVNGRGMLIPTNQRIIRERKAGSISKKMETTFSEAIEKVNQRMTSCSRQLLLRSTAHGFFWETIGTII
jgi:hypothetical protein